MGNLNVIGKSHITAALEGEGYFTRKKNNYRKAITVINVKPISETAKTKISTKSKSTTKNKAKTKAKTAAKK